MTIRIYLSLYTLIGFAVFLYVGEEADARTLKDMLIIMILWPLIIALYIIDGVEQAIR